MKHCGIVFVIILLVLFANGCTMLSRAPMTPVSASSLPQGDAARGRTLFLSPEVKCQSCHPNGSGGFGPSLKGASPDQIATYVRNGRGQMPTYPQSRLGDQDLADIIAYVTSIK